MAECADGADERDGQELSDCVSVDARGVQHLGRKRLGDHLAGAEVVSVEVVETADCADIWDSDEVVCVIAVDTGDIENHIAGDIDCSSRCEEFLCSECGGAEQTETTDEGLVGQLTEIVAVDAGHLEDT